MRKVLSEKLEVGRIRTGSMSSDSTYGPYGAFLIQGPCGEKIGIVAAGGDMADEGWEHVSVSTKRRLPNWTEMCFVKDLFWDDEECVVQFHPPKSTYVNNHPNCLHLWKHITEKFPTPPSILVGVKEEGVLQGRDHAEAIRKKLGLT